MVFLFLFFSQGEAGLQVKYTKAKYLNDSFSLNLPLVLQKLFIYFVHHSVKLIFLTITKMLIPLIIFSFFFPIL